MEIEGFNEIFNVLYIAKMLHNMDKSDLIETCLTDDVAYDCYYLDMYSLMDCLFAYHRHNFYDYRCVEVHIISDPVIVDFYTLAGKYGRRKGFSYGDNPYIKEAMHQTELNLNFSYAMDWKLMGYTEPKRPYHSRLGLFISQDGEFDMGFLMYRLLEVYKWFEGACQDLHGKLYGGVIKEQITLWEAVKAA